MRPSEEMRWKRFYPEGIEERIVLPRGMTLWGYFGGLMRGRDPSTIVWDYYGSRASTSLVLHLVDELSSALSALGLRKGEPVLCYLASSPLVLVMMLALSRIGAVPMYMNPNTVGDDLRSAARGVRFAFVNDVLFRGASDVFTDSTFEKVVVAPLSYGASGIVKTVIDFRSRSRRKGIVYDDHVLRLSRFLKLYSAPVVEAPYEEGRPALMTSSSGSTGVPKIIIDSDDSALASVVIITECIRDRFEVCNGSFNYLPPFASTSLDILTLVPLQVGEPIGFVSVVTPAEFNEAMFRFRASATLTCGTNWLSFAHALGKALESGRRPDLSTLSLAVLGGDGVSPKAIRRLNALLSECGCRYPVLPGYGQSEAFSVVTACIFDGVPVNEDVPGCPVGIPLPGYTVGIFDEEGNELGYGVPGELRYTGPSVFEGYYGRPSEGVIAGGWVRSGDCCILDEDGCLHVLGRYSGSVRLDDGTEFHPFMVERALENDPAVTAALAFIHDEDGGKVLRIHIVPDGEPGSSDLARLRNLVSDLVPEGVGFGGFRLHEVFEPNDRTFKADTELYREQRDGFIIP